MAEENKSKKVSGSVSGNLNTPQTIEEMEQTLRISKCLQGEPVCVINDRQAPHKGMKSAKDWANAIFDEWGNKVISPELGEIVVNVHSVNDTFAHGLSPFKIEAIRSIKDVVEQGVVFAQTRVEDRDHYFIAAPITLENQVDIVSVLVHKDMNTQRMYLHSVMIREKILEKNFEQKNTPEHLVRSADSRELSEPNRKLYSGDVGRILQNYLKVNIRELEVEINQQIEQQKGNKMDEMTEQTVSGNLKDAVSWFDTQEQFQWSNGATNYYKQEAQFIVDTVTKYPHRDGEPFVAISGSEYPALYPLNDKLDKVSIQAAEMIFVKLDGQMDGYYKTNVEVFNHSGELLAERRYDLADRNGGLFNLLVEDERQIDNAVYLSQYLPQDEKMNLLDRIDKQMEVDNNYAMRYPEVKEARMATMSNRGAFFERLQQQILQQDKTVEQHLSEMVDEVVAIANRQNVEQRQPENEERQNAVQTQELSGNLKAESTPLDALQALGKVEFITPALNKEQDALNETLQGLTAEQRKAVEPLYKQLEASHELRQMYQEYGDTIGVEDIEKHINRIEWAFRNKVKAFNEPQVDYSDMNYYKGVENTINKMREENEQRQPETISGSPNQDSSPQVMNDGNISSNPEPKTETQPQIDEPKNFVQNQANSDKMPQNSPDNSILGVENASKSTQDLISNLSNPETFQKQVLFAKVPETEVSKMIDEIAKSRTYLAVDFDNKDAAKAAGAKYDPQAKCWYAVEVTPELRQFLPQQPENITAERRPMSDFIATAQKIGLDLNNNNFKEEFGRWIRVPLKGKGARNTDGGYKLYRNDDGSIGGCVKNYSTNDTSTWNDRIQDGKQIQSKVPLPDYLANQRQKEWNTIAQHTAQSNVAAMRGEVATQAYHALQPALPDDPYIKNKGIAEIGKLKRLDDGSTIVPLYNNGKIANLQMIPSYDSKEKRMMTQAAKVGAYYSIGNTKTPSVVIVAEGVATADSVHQIASEIYGKDSVLTLSAVDSGNLPNVAAKVQHNFPNAQKIVAADNDALNATRAELKYKNAGLEKANEVKQAFADFQVALCPALTDEKGVVKNTDWNDFLKANGKTESVKAFSQNEQYIAQHSVKQQAATPQTKQQNNNKGRSL